MRPALAVVIPTCNRPALLERCLTAVAHQTMSPSRYEVVVVDDGTDQATRRLVDDWCRRGLERGLAIRYLVSPGRGPAAARNLGWRCSRAEIVAFTDDDCIPAHDWLEQGLAAFHDGLAGVSGRLCVPLIGQPTDYERNAALLAEAEFATANSFYRREALELVEGFDERFRLAWREDSDLHFALLRRGCRLGYAAQAIVMHPVRPARWGVSVQQQRKSMFNALLYKKHPELYRQRIQSRPPWHYYAITGSLLGGALGLLRRRRLPAAVAAGCWLVLTARFTLLRLSGTSRRPAHVLEMALTSIVIPPLAVFWRLLGALRFRVRFL